MQMRGFRVTHNSERRMYSYELTMFNKWRQIRSEAFCLLFWQIALVPSQMHVHTYTYTHNTNAHNTIQHAEIPSTACAHAHIHVHAQCKHAHPQHNPTCRNTFQIKRQNFTLACLQKTLQPTWNWFQFHKHNIVELWMSFHWTAKNAIPSSTQFAEYNPLKMGRSCK